MHSSGMRVSEVIHLHYDDISRTNMQIHVRDTKNRMDRYAILSKRCLDILTQYWFEKGRPRRILFPNKFTGNYLTVSTLEQVMRRAVSDAELPVKATPHSLRHPNVKPKTKIFYFGKIVFYDFRVLICFSNY